MPVNEEDIMMAQEVYEQLKPYMSTSAPRTKETLDNVLNLLYGAVNGKEKERQLAILEALVDIFKTKFNKLGFMQKAAVSAASGFIPSGPGKDFFDNVSPKSNKGNSEQRAKNLLKVVLENSTLAIESSVSTSMASRDSRSSSDATIFDEDEEIESLKTLEFNRYKKVLEELSEFCKILLLTINKNKDLNIDQDIVKNLIKVDGNVFKELKNLKQQENFQPNVQNLLDSVNHAMIASSMLDAQVRIRQNQLIEEEQKQLHGKVNKELPDAVAKRKHNTLQKEMNKEMHSVMSHGPHDIISERERNEKFLNENMTYATRIINALSSFMDIIFKIKDSLSKYFFGDKNIKSEKIDVKLGKEDNKVEKTSKPDDKNEKNLLLFMNATGLSRKDAVALSDLKSHFTKNYEEIRSKLK